MKWINPLAIAAIAVLTFVSCDPCKPGKTITFTGTVLSNSGKAVPKAVIQINNEKATSAEDGSFSLCVPRQERNKFLVSIRKKGFGLFSSSVDSAFVNRKIYLTEGTVITFDPTRENILEDKNSANNPFKPALLSLDTAVLFKAIPKVYNAQGDLIDLGYPDEIKNVFDYLKIPVTGGPGISVTLPANSIVDINGNAPSSGTQLQAALSTVDFFNPDGMPGDFLVRTKNGLTYMESFSAGTVEIFDGEKAYKLKDGARAKIKFPVYPIRLQLKENLPEEIPLLHFNETDGVWEEDGVGKLNAEKNAYEAEVRHFSVLNMDAIKTGPSKCYKFRQMMKFGATSDFSRYLSTYRAQVIIPASATSTFKENQYLVDEAMGCMPVTVPTLASQTRLHPVTRIPDSKYIVVIFSKTGVSDTLDIAVAQQATTTVPAETIVASAFDCSTAGTSAACTGCNATDVHDAGLGTPSPCNTTCWLSDCAFFPFENYTNEVRIVGVAKTGKQVKIAYINKAAAFTGIKINVSTSPTCGTGTLFTSRCANANQCGAGECDYGEFTYTHSGAVGDKVYFQIQVYNDYDGVNNHCNLMPVAEDCSNEVTIQL